MLHAENELNLGTHKTQIYKLYTQLPSVLK